MVATKIRKLHAREIIRSARRQGVKPARCFSDGWCPVAIINQEVFGQHFAHYNNAQQNVATHFGVTVDDIRALEIGFEDWSNICHVPFMKNPYYKVGRNVAKLAGLG